MRPESKSWSRFALNFIVAALTAAIIWFVVGAYIKTYRDLDAMERAVGTGKPH